MIFVRWRAAKIINQPGLILKEHVRECTVYENYFSATNSCKGHVLQIFSLSLSDANPPQRQAKRCSKLITAARNGERKPTDSGHRCVAPLVPLEVLVVWPEKSAANKELRSAHAPCTYINACIHAAPAWDARQLIENIWFAFPRRPPHCDAFGAYLVHLIIIKYKSRVLLEFFFYTVRSAHIIAQTNTIVTALDVGKAITLWLETRGKSHILLILWFLSLAGRCRPSRKRSDT